MLFTIVTFPFLFGIMYGDVGHGSMVMCLGLWAMWKSESLRYSLPALFNFRYMIFMMGFFGMYAGFLYNDLFSVGLPLMPSRWAEIETHGHAHPGSYHGFTPTYDTRNEGGTGPYPFGLDPAWHGATNELMYLNSMKMKISVIFGVVQMIAGLLLRCANSVHERNWLDLICEWVPMMVFMICFFGFMDYMILHKWVTPIPEMPSIINSLICMA